MDGPGNLIARLAGGILLLLAGGTFVAAQQYQVPQQHPNTQQFQGQPQYPTPQQPTGQQQNPAQQQYQVQPGRTYPVAVQPAYAPGVSQAPPIQGPPSGQFQGPPRQPFVPAFVPDQIRLINAQVDTPRVQGGAPGQLPAPAPEEIPGAAVPPLELVEFRDMSLTDAVRLLSDQAGMKIVPSSEASQVRVTLYLRDVQPQVALDAMTKAHGLFYRQDRTSGIIRIYTTEEYERDLGSFRDEQTEVFTLLYPNPVDVAVAIQALFGTRVQLNIGTVAAGDLLTYQDLQQRFTRYNLVNQQNQTQGIGGGGFGGGVGGFGGGVGGGGFGGIGGGGFGGGGLGGFGGGGLGGFGGGGLGGFGGGGLGGFGGGGLGGFGGGGLGQQGFGQQGFGQNIPGQVGLETQPLESLTPDMIMKLEEARNSSSEEGKSAIDELLRTHRARIYVTVIRRNNQVVIRTGDEQIMQRIRELIQNLDVPTPLVLLEVKVMELDLGDKFTSVFDYQLSDGSSLAAGFTAGNILPPTTDVLSGSARRNDQAGIGFPSSAAGSNRDLTFQFVNNSFRARIQLLENNNRVTNLATPLLLTANNEVSHIFIGQQIPLVIGYTQSGAVAGGLNGGAIAVQPSPQTQLTQVGQGLLITPNINADRTVTLRVSQQNSTVDVGGATIPIVDSTGNIVNLEIDVLNSAVVTGTVVAKDGLAVAIGGLINEKLSDTRIEVPILGRLPVVGFFFRKQQTNRVRTELVIMIRPYVFNTPSESASLSADLLQELSLHPISPNGQGTLNSFVPPEVLRASPPDTKLQQIFRFHSLVPKLY